MNEEHKADKATLRWWEQLGGLLRVRVEGENKHRAGKKQQRKARLSRAGRRARKAKRGRAKLSRRLNR